MQKVATKTRLTLDGYSVSEHKLAGRYPTCSAGPYEITVKGDGVSVRWSGGNIFNKSDYTASYNEEGTTFWMHFGNAFRGDEEVGPIRVVERKAYAGGPYLANPRNREALRGLGIEHRECGLSMEMLEKAMEHKGELSGKLESSFWKELERVHRHVKTIERVAALQPEVKQLMAEIANKPAQTELKVGGSPVSGFKLTEDGTLAGSAGPYGIVISGEHVSVCWKCGKDDCKAGYGKDGDSFEFRAWNPFSIDVRVEQVRVVDGNPYIGGEYLDDKNREALKGLGIEPSEYGLSMDMVKKVVDRGNMSRLDPSLWMDRGSISKRSPSLLIDMDSISKLSPSLWKELEQACRHAGEIEDAAALQPDIRKLALVNLDEYR